MIAVQDGWEIDIGQESALPRHHYEEIAASSVGGISTSPQSAIVRRDV
jgi:hypothetical protein